MKETFIGLRTHFVDERVLRLAAELRDATDCEFALVLDETRSEIDSQGLPKIGLTNAALDRLGLYRGFEGAAWRCGDYGLYLAKQKFDRCRFFWLIEHDVRLNFRSAAEFFELFRGADATDFFAAGLREADAHWFWRRSMSAHHARVHRCLFPIVRASARALDHLSGRRRALCAEAASAPAEALWANDEAFAATELMNGGFVCRDFNALGAPLYTKKSFSFEGPIAQSEFEKKEIDRLLYHPVLHGRHLFEKILRMTRSNGDVDGAIAIVRGLAGREWTAAEADGYVADVRAHCRPATGWRARLPRWLRRDATTRLG